MLAADDAIFIGKKLFIDVHWKLNSQKLNFYLHDCQLSTQNSDMKVRIIEENCYSKTLETKLIGKSHFSENSSSKFR